MKKITFILFIVSQTIAYSQWFPLSSQRELNLMYINPATCGWNQSHDVDLQYRRQWIGSNDISNLSSVGYNGALTTHVGLGGYIMNQSFGDMHLNTAAFSYAYHLKMESFNLSFGLSGLASQGSIILGTMQTLEPTLNSRIVTPLIPGVSFGVFAYNMNFFAGGSYTKTYPVNAADQTTISSSQIISLQGGYIYHYSDKTKVTPNAFYYYYSYSNQTLHYLQFGVNADYNTQIFGSVNMRFLNSHPDALVFLFGFWFNKHFRLAVSYDMPIGNSQSLYQINSSDISLAYSFSKFTR